MAASTLLLRRYLCSSPAKGKVSSKAAVALLKSENSPERILEICRSASLSPDSHHGRIAFSVAISKLLLLSSPESIPSLLEELIRLPHLRTERFASHSMLLYAQARMLPNAISTFQSLHHLGIHRSITTLNSLLFACILAEGYDDARRVFLDFPNRYHLKPDLDTYNFMIKALCNSGSSTCGYSVVSEMDKAGFKPDATTFGALIQGFYREDRLDEVARVLKMMDHHRMKPGLEVFNIRIKGLCKLGRSADAAALLHSMLSRGMLVNVVSYNHLIHGFCKEGNVGEATRLFKTMEGRGCEPDSSCYFTLIHFLSQSGDYDTALQLCRECMKKNWVPYFTIMKLLVEGLASISKLDEARHLVVQVKAKFPKNAQLWKHIEDSLKL